MDNEEMTDFSKLPYNTERLYIVTEIPGGCMIYVPVAGDDSIYKAQVRLANYFGIDYEKKEEIDGL